MKIYVAIILTSLICITMQTKAQIHIQGKVMDENKNPLSYAHIKIKNNQQIQNNIVCDSNGFFEIKQFKYDKNLQIQASYLNDTSISYTIDSANKNFVFTIGIKQLNEVVVKTQKPLIERKADRMIYNIGDKPLYQNMDVSQLLNSIPRVYVDPLTNEIAIRGRGYVKVMIDNRIINFSGQALLNYLATYQNEIERIEIIPNPPSEYSSEGNGGLINIILKKGKINKIETSIYTQLRQNKYFGLSDGIGFKYNQNNFSLYANASSYNGNTYSESNNYTEFNNPNITNWQENSNNKYKNNGYSFSLDLEYQLSVKSKINFNLAYDFSNSVNLINQIFDYYKIKIDSLGLGLGNESSNSINKSVGLTYKYNFKKGSNYFLLSADWLSPKSESILNTNSINYINDTKTPTNIYIQNYSFGNTNINLFSGKLDFVWDELIFNKINFKTGLKYNEFLNSSITDYDLKYNDISVFKTNNLITYNNFTYLEKVAAAYTSIDKDWDKFSFNFGLRYEKTNTLGQGSNGLNYINNYDNLFPSAFIQWKMNDEYNFDIGYTRRINRPDLYSLNPYRHYFNQYYYSEGNPFLNGSISNNLELNSTIKNVFFINIHYTMQNKPITQLITTDLLNMNAVYQKAENIGFSESYGYNIDFVKDISKIYNLTISTSFDKYYFNSGLSNINQNNNRYQFFISNINTFKFNKSFTITIYENWLLPGSAGNFELQSRQTGKSDVSIIIDKKINNRLSLNLTLLDIFKTGQVATISETSQFFSYRYSYYGLQSIRLKLNYRFGKKLKNINKESSLEGEQNRLIKNK